MVKKIFRILHVIVVITFFTTSLGIQSYAQAMFEAPMPVPGSMVNLSQTYVPAHLMGLQIDPKDPFHIDFLISKGEDKSKAEYNEEEYLKMVKYFMASLTVPNSDQWVNLSPYESKRIISNELGFTEMGRDLLAQDYLLKQLTASLIYPEKEIGQKFWKEIYQKINAKYGLDVKIPVNTFNKVWIMPESALIYEKGNQAWIVKSTMNVMLEMDYVAAMKHQGSNLWATGQINPNTGLSTVGTDIIRNIVIPVIKKEVNEGKNFAVLRQIYNAMVLATWYKKELKQSILTKVYGDARKVKGIDLVGQVTIENIYQQYLKAYKKGVFNYIKEDIDPVSQQAVPRKYFSGGFIDTAGDVLSTNRNLGAIARTMTLDDRAHYDSETGDVAMLSISFTNKIRGAIPKVLASLAGLALLTAPGGTAHAAVHHHTAPASNIINGQPSFSHQEIKALKRGGFIDSNNQIYPKVSEISRASFVKGLRGLRESKEQKVELYTLIHDAPVHSQFVLDNGGRPLSEDVLARINSVSVYVPPGLLLPDEVKILENRYISKKGMVQDKVATVTLSQFVESLPGWDRVLEHKQYILRELRKAWQGAIRDSIENTRAGSAPPPDEETVITTTGAGSSSAKIDITTILSADAVKALTEAGFLSNHDIPTRFKDVDENTFRTAPAIAKWGRSDDYKQGVQNIMRGMLGLPPLRWTGGSTPVSTPPIILTFADAHQNLTHLLLNVGAPEVTPEKIADAARQYAAVVTALPTLTPPQQSTLKYDLTYMSVPGLGGDSIPRDVLKQLQDKLDQSNASPEAPTVPSTTTPVKPIGTTTDGTTTSSTTGTRTSAANAVSDLVENPNSLSKAYKQLADKLTPELFRTGRHDEIIAAMNKANLPDFVKHKLIFNMSDSHPGYGTEDNSDGIDTDRVKPNYIAVEKLIGDWQGALLENRALSNEDTGNLQGRIQDFDDGINNDPKWGNVNPREWTGTQSVVSTPPVVVETSGPLSKAYKQLAGKLTPELFRTGSYEEIIAAMNKANLPDFVKHKLIFNMSDSHPGYGTEDNSDGIDTDRVKPNYIAVEKLIGDWQRALLENRALSNEDTGNLQGRIQDFDDGINNDPKWGNVNPREWVDRAQFSNRNGGINFDAAQLNMQIKRDGQGMPLPIYLQDPALLNLQGLFPVVLSIQLMPQSEVPHL